jgi:hypothetical protein
MIISEATFIAFFFESNGGELNPTACDIFPERRLGSSPINCYKWKEANLLEVARGGGLSYNKEY